MSGIFTAAMVASLAGTAGSEIASNQNMRKQDNQAAAAIQNQDQLKSQAQQKLDALNQSITKSNPKNAQTQQDAAYTAALQQAAPTQATVNPAVKGGSKRYTAATQAAQADVANYAKSTASNLAATSAPQLQRIQEGNEIADTASQLGLIQDTSNQDNSLLRTQLAGDQANPWLLATSQLLSGAGSGLAKKYGWNSAAPPPAQSGGI